MSIRDVCFLALYTLYLLGQHLPCLLLELGTYVGLKTGGRHGVPGVYDVKLGLCLLDYVNGSPGGESGVLGAVAGQQDLRKRKGLL